MRVPTRRGKPAIESRRARRESPALGTWYRPVDSSMRPARTMNRASGIASSAPLPASTASRPGEGVPAAAAPVAHLEELDGLRGLLSWWVVVIHTLSTAGIDLESTWLLRQLFGATIRVKLFAALSGFVIANLLTQRRESYPVFLARRLIRLYPVYVVCLGASGMLLGFDIEVLEALPWRSEVQGAWLSYHRTALERFWTHLAVHLTLAHGVVPEWKLHDAAFTILGQAWNISTECQFYVLAPLLIGLVVSKHLARRCLGLALFVALYACRGYPNPAFLGTYALYFLLGVLSLVAVRWLLRADKVALMQRSRVGGTSVVIAAGALIATRNLALSIWLLVLAAALVRIASAGAARIEGAVCRLLTLRPALYSARLSYPIYLCHMTVILPVAYVATGTFGTRLGPLGYFACIAAVSAPLITVLAHLLHVGIEAPTIAWGRRLGRRR